MRNNKGITLIALVITIIIMLILVAVTITIAINGGLFGYAGRATHDTELAKQEEQKLGEGYLEVNGKRYDTPGDFIDGIESGSEKFSEIYTSTDEEFTDEDGTPAVIPEGFAVGISEGINKVADGLVIQDENGNQFVWIPVPEKNMKIASSSNLYVGETDMSEPKNITNIDMTTNSAPSGPYTMDSQTELNWYYGNNYFTYSTDFAYNNHYREMAESINEYGGFYIGRYETTIDSNNNIGSKYNTKVLTGDTILKEGTNPNKDEPYYYRWWGLYYAQRRANVTGNGSIVQTNMIWGQEWDKMITHFDTNNINYEGLDYTNLYDKQQNSIVASGQARYTPKEGVTGAEEIKDKIYNIYDLRANGSEWTAESLDVSLGRRITRSGNFNSGDNISVSYRYTLIPHTFPYTASMYNATRLTLYIK